MSKIEIGRAGGKPVHLDLEVLLRTRLLIQANSGGGKSYLIRRLAEEAFGKVPVHIIDAEGEFSTLRERFGYVLVGNGRMNTLSRTPDFFGPGRNRPRRSQATASRGLTLKGGLTLERGGNRAMGPTTGPKTPPPAFQALT